MYLAIIFLCLLNWSSNNIGTNPFESITHNQAHHTSTLSINDGSNIAGDNFEMAIEILDSAQFYAIKKEAKNTVQPLEKITDFQVAKSLLKDVVEFDDADEEAVQGGLRRIFFRNGGVYTAKYREEYFVAYFPDEDILLLEGRYSSDVSYNLKTGATTVETGNPDYIVASPHNQFRLNGFFDGQECVDYFIQTNTNGQFENSIPLNNVFFKTHHINLCQTTDIFWTNDHTLFFKERIYGNEELQEEYQYYKITIRKAEPLPQKREVFNSPNINEFVPKNFVLYKEEGLNEIKGDLNKNGLDDQVLLIKGTDPSYLVQDAYRGELDRNRRGIIILFNKGNHYELALKNIDCFSSENEDGGAYYPPELDVEIAKGNLYIHYRHGRYGYWTYTFRYQNRDFELIGYDQSSHHGPIVLNELSVNFLTRRAIRRKNVNEMTRDSGEEVLKETQHRIPKRELIRLSEIIDFDQLDIEELSKEE